MADDEYYYIQIGESIYEDNLDLFKDYINDGGIASLEIVEMVIRENSKKIFKWIIEEMDLVANDPDFNKKQVFLHMFKTAIKLEKCNLINYLLQVTDIQDPKCKEEEELGVMLTNWCLRMGEMGWFRHFVNLGVPFDKENVFQGLNHEPYLLEELLGKRGEMCPDVWWREFFFNLYDETKDEATNDYIKLKMEEFRRLKEWINEECWSLPFDVVKNVVYPYF